METEKLIEIAKHYYEILKHKVELFNLGGLYVGKHNFEQFCEDLGGNNLEFWDYEKTEGLFDVNYGNICATIIYRKGKCQLSKSIEIWEENIVFDDYQMA